MLDKREPGVRDMLLYHPERENPVQYSTKTEKCTQNSYVRFADSLFNWLSGYHFENRYQ